MYYNSFLLLLSQLAFQEEGNILLNGCVIRVKALPSSSLWELKAKLTPGSLSPEVLVYLQSGRKFPLESESIYLKKDREGIALIQTIPSPKKYLQYKCSMENFFETLSLWEEEAKY